MHSHFAVAYTAIEQRRHALAAYASFGASHGDSMIQRGIDEALACQDMLAPAPHQPSPIARLWAHLAGIMRSLALRNPIRADRPVRTVPTGTNFHATRRPMG